MHVKCPKGFELMTESYWLEKPVFDLVICTDNSAIAPINRSLKQLGTYVRLYYYMIWAYKDYIDENPELKKTVYHVENIRREIQKKINEYDDPHNNELRLQLLSDVHTIMLVGSRIIQIYQQARDWCLSREVTPKHERLRRIYDVIDAEQKLFIGYPETKYAYGMSGEKYIRDVFGNTELSPENEEILNQFKRKFLQQPDSTPSN